MSDQKLAEALRLALPILEHERFKQDASYGGNFSQTRADRARKALDAAREALATAPQAPQPAQADQAQAEGADNCEPSDKARIAMLEALVADREKSLRKLRAAAEAAPQPEAQPHSLVSDREYLRIFEAARHGSSAPVGTLRGIRACIAAYEVAAPSAQAEPMCDCTDYNAERCAAGAQSPKAGCLNGRKVQAEQGGK